MIAKKYRTPRQSIDYILKKGESYDSKLFIVRFVKNNESFCRYRVIVSKKLYTKAVSRNHLRRQIYEAIRLSTATDQQKTSHSDIILIPKKRILSNNYQEITKDLTTNIIPHT